MTVTKVIASAATLGLAVLWSSAASAQDPVAPGGEQPREIIRPNRPLLIAGAAVIAASYTPAVIVAATSEHKGDEHLYIPIAGPWIDLGDRTGSGGCAPNSCSEEAVYKTLLITTGIAHLVGTGLVVSSFIVPEERPVRTTASTAPKPMKPMVLPAQVGRTGAGLALVGTF